MFLILDKSIVQGGDDLSKVKDIVNAKENKEIKDIQGPRWPLSFDYIKGLVDLTLLSPQATEQDIRMYKYLRQKVVTLQRSDEVNIPKQM